MKKLQSYSNQLTYSTLALLGIYSLYKHYQLRSYNQQIKELTLDRNAGEILLYSQLVAFPSSFVTLPNGTKVPLSSDMYKKLHVSNTWDRSLTEFIVGENKEKEKHQKINFDVENGSAIVVFNTSSLGNTAILLADYFSKEGKDITIYYLDANNTSIEVLKKHCTTYYPNVNPILLNFENFTQSQALDDACLKVIDQADFCIVQGPWSPLVPWLEKKLDDVVYQQSAYASFFSTSVYRDFKTTLMQTCLSKGVPVIETTHKLIADRMKANEPLSDCITSPFIPVSPSAAKKASNGIFIHTPTCKT